MHILDNLDAIKRYDSLGMMGLITSFPRQCREAKEIGLAFNLPRKFRKKYDNIVCAGLGGSAIGADIMRSYLLDEVRIPVFVNRCYGLPGFVNNRTLVIASSYSGNTEETLSAYKDALRKGADIIAITSGGSLARSARSAGWPVLLIPGGLPPRAALGYSSVTLLIVLAKIGIIKDHSLKIDEAIDVMDTIRTDSLGPGVPMAGNTAKKLAQELYGKYPVIYGSQDKIDAVVTRWRGQLAENSKTLSSSHYFPEMDHNEIVGWDNPAALLKDFAVVMLRDKGDHPRVAKRIDITEKVIKNSCGSVTEVYSCGKGLLAKIFSLVYTGDFASFYLAILNRRDPTPVGRINYLKEQLAK